MFQYKILQHVIQSFIVIFSVQWNLLFIQNCFEPLLGECNLHYGHSVALEARDWSVSDRKEIWWKMKYFLPHSMEMTHRFIQKHHHVTHDSSVWLKMKVKVWVSVAVFSHEASRCTKIQMQLNPWSWSKLPVGDRARTTNICDTLMQHRHNLHTAKMPLASQIPNLVSKLVPSNNIVNKIITINNYFITKYITKNNYFIIIQS